MFESIQDPPHVIIVGGGFGGLYAAQELGGKPVRVTLIDKRNFHLFQPLLYQVATGSLSAAEIASPLRAVLHEHRNIQVLLGEVHDIDPARKRVYMEETEIPYDMLILATGGRHHYFGHDEWADRAPGLKTLEDALNIRQRIFMGFEEAERETDLRKRAACLTYVIVGGGPTGVELAGALGDLTQHTLRGEFHNIHPEETRIILLESGPRLLGTYPEDLSAAAEEKLQRLGVTIKTNTMVTNITDSLVTIKTGDTTDHLEANTILWAAGVTASPLSKKLAERANIALDHSGRIIVTPDFSVPGFPDFFAIGDLAHYEQNGSPLPGVAAVAMQEGEYVAYLIHKRIRNEKTKPFRYRDKGSMAVIGRSQAVAALGKFHLKGFMAWLIWAFVHIRYLVEFENRLLVFMQWSWSFITRKQGARLITSTRTMTTE